MNRLERRAIGRVSFPSNAIIVLCDTQEVLYVNVRDLGPIGVGAEVPNDTADLVGKDVILVAETLIMYADVVRQAPTADGTFIVGLAARKFPKDVLQFLIDGMEMRSQLEGISLSESINQGMQMDVIDVEVPESNNK